MSDTFEFVYEVEEAQWNALAQDESGLGGEPAFRHLLGTLEIRANNKTLWTRPYPLSLLDIAISVAEMRSQGFPFGTRTAVIRETDGPLEVTFECDGNVVRVASNLEHASATVPTAAFENGVAHFLSDIAGALAKRAPAVLTDAEIAPLYRWAHAVQDKP